jgi:hypothetical protein
MEAITWNEVKKLCKISLETNTDHETDSTVITIKNKKMNHSYTHRINNKLIRDREMMLRLVNVKSRFIGDVIQCYINQSKLESYFGEIKI